MKAVTFALSCLNSLYICSSMSPLVVASDTGSSLLFMALPLAIDFFCGHKKLSATIKLTLLALCVLALGMKQVSLIALYQIMPARFISNQLRLANCNT